MRVAGLLFGAPDAGSFVAAGARGLELACSEFGCTLDLRYCDSREPTDRVAALQELAERGADLIVLHGGQGDAPLAAVAPRFPRQRFALNQGLLTAPNIARYTVLLEQPAYLAGALAAWHSRTGVVAHLSGEAVGPGLRGEAAFRAGALRARPDVQVHSRFCGDQHDPDRASQAVHAHAQAGADVVFTMLGEGRAGAIDACRARGMRQIGDGIDWCLQAPDVFLASAIADTAWCAQQAVSDAWHGVLPPGGGRSVGLEQPAVCRLAMASDVPPALRDRVAALGVPAL